MKPSSKNSGFIGSHKARKRFGQNFLTNPAIIQQILTAISPANQDQMLEIGPGLGAITTPLITSVNKLFAVELDRDLFQKLTTKFQAHENFELHNADILKFNIADLVAKINEQQLNQENYAKPKLRVVGNIPYNISTPLIFHLLSFSTDILDIHLMVQREVALRLTATPGNKAYGRLSVMTQACSQTELLFDVRPESFSPPPAVQSSFIRIIPDPNQAATIKDLNLLQKITTTAFNQRRKTITNALKTVASIESLQAAGIDPSSRPEQVSVAKYIALANSLGNSNPIV